MCKNSLDKLYNYHDRYIPFFFKCFICVSSSEETARKTTHRVGLQQMGIEAESAQDVIKPGKLLQQLMENKVSNSDTFLTELCEVFVLTHSDVDLFVSALIASVICSRKSRSRGLLESISTNMTWPYLKMWTKFSLTLGSRAQAADFRQTFECFQSNQSPGEPLFTSTIHNQQNI